MNEHVFAYTETDGRSYPGYVNVSRAEGGIVITARTQGFDGNKSGCCFVPSDEVAELAEALNAMIARDSRDQRST